MKTKSYFQKMRHVAVAVLLMGTSAMAQNERFDHATSERDLETAKATVEAYEAQDWNQLRSFLADDATFYGLASFDSLDVEETISYWTRGSEQSTPELKDKTWLSVAVPDGPRQGHWVYHWGVNTISYTNGDRTTFPYHIALKMENDKVAEAHFYYDNMKIIRDMGYAISPPLEDGEPVEEVLDLNFETRVEK